MTKLPDIDIDFGDRELALKLIKHIGSSIIDNGVIKKHNSGVHYTRIPSDPDTGLSSLDYKIAESRGYFKLDLLNVSVYQKVKDKEHLEKLLDKEPLWDLLWKSKDFCERIIHIGNYYNLVCEMKPDTIPRMAMFLSVIRPGKSYLQKKPWAEISKEVWIKPETNQYHFKKAHAVAYAKLVALHINLLCEEYQKD